MRKTIQTACDRHGVVSENRYRDRHEIAMAKARAHGKTVEVHERRDPVQAFVNDGTWRIFCECGDAPAAHPKWSETRCFDCGAVHTRTVFPADVTGIEAALVLRPMSDNRFWDPGETAADLRAQNRSHGLPGRPGEERP